MRWTPFRCSLPTPSRFLAPDGTLRVDLLLADRTWPSAAMSRALERPVLIVTDRGLSTRECRSVLGLSARRRGMAAVSIQGLEGDPRRLRNLALHELGHLKGWRHCTTSGCLMTPVTTPADLDSRDDFLCRDCAKEKHVTCNRCSRKGGSWFPGKVGQIGFRSPGARKHSQADPSCVLTSQEDCP